MKRTFWLFNIGARSFIHQRPHSGLPAWKPSSKASDVQHFIVLLMNCFSSYKKSSRRRLFGAPNCLKTSHLGYFFFFFYVSFGQISSKKKVTYLEQI